MPSVMELIEGPSGPASIPAAADPANGVPVYAVLRRIFDAQVGAAGVAAYPAAAAPANAVSMAEVLREIFDVVPKGVNSATAVLTNATTIFTIANGPIEILSLVGVCVTTNDGTAATLQYSADPTDGAATTISGASASLASVAAGATAILTGVLATAPTIVVAGTAISQGSGGTGGGIIVPEGIITTVIASGPTTGTWKHCLIYRPLGRGVTVT